MKWGERDPSLLKRALISYVFHEPIAAVAEFSAEEIDKWSDAALWIIDSIMYAPFKSKK
jgi:hypothetical protein